LANIALHGLAATIEDAFPKHKELPSGRAHWTPVVIRYADDFVVIHRDRQVIDRVREIAAEWLKGMGLEMKPSKTRITHTLEAVDGPAGFDFLEFHFRQYERGKNHSVRDGMGRLMGFVPQVRPSAASQKRLLQKVREVLHAHRAWPQEAVIGKLNPILRGWGRYFSIGVSSKVFHKMDHLIFKKLWAWACRRHSNKSRSWIARTYWSFRKPTWTFSTKGGFKLHKLSEISTQRHIKVNEDRSPFDGDSIYWGSRMGRYADLPWGVASLLKQQRGICPTSDLYFKYGDRLAWVSLLSQAADGKPRKKPAVVHEHCRHVTRNDEVCDDSTPLD
jgi:RNA-directed DNA polymerase